MASRGRGAAETRDRLRPAGEPLPDRSESRERRFVAVVECRELARQALQLLGAAQHPPLGSSPHPRRRADGLVELADLTAADRAARFFAFVHLERVELGLQPFHS